eukprot:COSAG06_NODE_21123_length_768_cov_2.288490_1_plen_59_part_00
MNEMNQIYHLFNIDLRSKFLIARYERNQNKTTNASKQASKNSPKQKHFFFFRKQTFPE